MHGGIKKRRNEDERETSEKWLCLHDVWFMSQVNSPFLWLSTFGSKLLRRFNDAELKLGMWHFVKKKKESRKRGLVSNNISFYSLHRKVLGFAWFCLSYWNLNCIKNISDATNGSEPNGCWENLTWQMR